MTNYIQPIVIERADPWVYKHHNGKYYFTGSVPDFKSIELRCADSINELGSTNEIKTIWKAHETGVLSELIWAPEIHYINSKWYIYFAASDHATIRDQFHHHRMFVLENENENPMEGEWVEKGQIITQFESFSIDATVFELKNELYYVWAQLDPRIPGNSNLYLSKMENPWTLKGKQTLLSVPEYEWEKIGYKVNEGAAVIIRNGKVFITYSGSATDENYAMGLLWADENADLLDGYSWNKAVEPVFKTSEANKLYGPGHNSFTISEDGKYDVLVYHARPTKNDIDNPLNNPNRHTHAQIFSWDANGFPVFGVPGGKVSEF